MEDGFSTIDAGSLLFDLPNSHAVCPEVEAVLADEKRREKEIEKDLEAAFGNSSSEEESESEDESDAESQVERSGASGHDESSGRASNASQDSKSGYTYSSVRDSEHSAFPSNAGGQDSSIKNADDHSYMNGEDHHSDDHSYHEHNHSLSGDLNAQGDYADVSTSMHQKKEFEDLRAEYMKLQLIYESNRKELEEVKKSEVTHAEEADRNIRTLEIKLAFLEDEKNRLISNLQESKNLISDFKHENTVLLGKVNSLDLQLSTTTKAKDDALSQLESCEVTIHSLEKQIHELNRSENLSRMRDQQNKMLEDMKLRHQKEILKLKENIDELQRKYNSKMLEAENLFTKNLDLQDKCEQLQLEKGQLFNKMSNELEATQKRCQQYLDSGTIEEVSLLKLQVQQLQEEKSNIEKINAAFKEEIKSLKIELSNSEALQKMAFSSKSRVIHNQTGSGRHDINFQAELEESLKNARSLREEKQALSKQLKEVKNELTLLKDNATLFESRWTESEKKVKELQEKLNAMSSSESSTISLHKQKCKSLEMELNEHKRKLQEVTEKLRETSHTAKVLGESNEDLQKRFVALVQKHTEDKIKAVEDCRERCLELHEGTLKKEKQKILSQSDAELKNVCTKYENRIAEMEKEIKMLNDELYDSKTRCVTLYQENENLQGKLDEVKKPKEREEIEKEVSAEYERKLNQMKAAFIRQNEEYLKNRLKSEVENEKLKWTQEQVALVKQFVEKTKQQMDEEFRNCLQEERDVLQNKLESEKEKFRMQYEESMKTMKKQHREEIEKLNAVLDQDLHAKWSKELVILKEHHEEEVNLVKRQFESKILDMELEMRKLKESVAVRLQEQEKIQKQNQDLKHQLDIWERERAKSSSKDLDWAETEQKLCEKINKYKRHVSALNQRHKEKVARLQAQLSELQKFQNEKQNELLAVKQKYEQELSDLDKRHLKNTGSQTQEEVVSKQRISDMEDKFYKCLKNISNGIQNYMIECKKRNAARLEEALHRYHQLVSEKMFQDISKDIHSFTPTFILPRASPTFTTSRETFLSSANSQNLHSAKFKTSTPDPLSSNNRYFMQNPNSGRQGLSSIDRCSSIPETRVKSVLRTSPLSNIESSNRGQNIYSSAFKSVSPNDRTGVNFALEKDLPENTESTNTLKNCISSQESGNFYNSRFKTHPSSVATDWTAEKSSVTKEAHKNEDLSNNLKNFVDRQESEADVQFSDISYDFLSLKIPGGLFDSARFPNYGFPPGYDKETNEFLANSFPVKLSPS